MANLVLLQLLLGWNTAMALATHTTPTCAARTAVKSHTMYVIPNLKSKIHPLINPSGQILGSRKRDMGSMASRADDQGSIRP